MAFGRKTRTKVDPRTGERIAVEIFATARLPAGEPVAIKIDDLSLSGFRAVVPLALKPGMLLRVGLPNGRSPHAIVVRSEGEKVGCAFMAPLEPVELNALLGDLPVS